MLSATLCDKKVNAIKVFCVSRFMLSIEQSYYCNHTLLLHFLDYFFKSVAGPKTIQFFLKKIYTQTFHVSQNA